MVELHSFLLLSLSCFCIIIVYFQLIFVDLCPNREGAVSLPQLWCNDRWRLLCGVLRSWQLLWSQRSLPGERQVCVAHCDSERRPVAIVFNHAFHFIKYALSVAFTLFKPPGLRRYSSSDTQPEGSGHPVLLSQTTGDKQWGPRHWLWNTKLLDW